jgi:hypothetical protein
MNHISEVKVSMLASSVVDCGFGSASELALYKSN